MKQRADCTVEFDQHSPEFAADPWRHLRAARELCPITWTEANGGFWLVTGYEEADVVLHDDELFSSGSGVSLPVPPKNGPPIDVDPPLYVHYRRALGPHTSARSLATLTDDITEWTESAIRRSVEAGEADLIADIGAVIPAMATMVLLGLPMENWQRYADVWHGIFAHPADPTVWEDHARLRLEIRETVVAKQSAPGDDIVSSMWQSPLFHEVGQVRGPDFSAIDEGTDVAMTLLGAGVDTTTNAFGSTAMWLARHPEERQRLRDDPELMKTAVEEFLRRWSVAWGLARKVTRDTELFGHQLREGEWVIASFMGANHDPREFPDPEAIILDRTPNRHMAFGVGLHRCLGSHLVRLTLPIMLRTLLDYAPDYEIDESRAQRYADCALVHGWTSIPARFPRVPATLTG
jgi:cytochrome P450